MMVMLDNLSDHSLHARGISTIDCKVYDNQIGMLCQYLLLNSKGSQICTCTRYAGIDPLKFGGWITCLQIGGNLHSVTIICLCQTSTNKCDGHILTIGNFSKKIRDTTAHYTLVISLKIAWMNKFLFMEIHRK
ncbi:hypothetical protein D3C72_1417840 [compost metagenome]